MGKVFLSCGHEDPYRPVQGWPLMVKSEAIDFEEGVIPSIEHVAVCRECFLKYVTNRPEDLIFDEYEVEEYFQEFVHG